LSGYTNRVDEDSEITIEHVRFEHHRDAIGIGEICPHLSWTVQTTVADWYQAGYEIEAYGPDGQIRERTERVDSDQSVLVPWPFSPLSSRESLRVRIRAWGMDGQSSAWSALYPVEAGLLSPSDWTSCFVTPDWEEDTSRPQPGPLLRREFDVHVGVSKARLYVTALGVYEAQLNGVTVGDHVLDPGWTSYNHRLCYQTFDVTGLLQVGRNAIGAMLGDGWFRGRLGFGGGRRNIYSDRLALLAQLEIDYADGTTERIVTDETWCAARGPILSNDIYDGETYDARLEQSGWSTIDYADSDWVGVKLLDRELSTLVAPLGPPVRRTQFIAPVNITTSPSGRTIVDFGQNLVGRLRLTASGKSGQMITLRHAEVLEDGELRTRPLRTALATDRYTLRGDGEETWEPRFTFHGFRYAEVEGWPGELRAEDIQAVVCHSDMERTGWFECSDQLINRLHENIVWSMRGNFLSIPTDCPQRDERLGWTGDIQVFAPTACFLYDVAGFLSSWLKDLAVEQAATGGVPLVVPGVVEGTSIPVAGWGDAAVIVPWVLYQRYGDAGVLDAQFESMRAWVDLVAHAADGYLWNRGFQLGDWLDPAAPPNRPAATRTNPYVIATAYFAHSAELLGQAAGILRRTEEEAHYLQLAAHVRDAFDAEYVTASGRVISDSETAYALVLQFALLRNPQQRYHAGKRLAALVRESRYHISTGFLGTLLICDALSSIGESDAAFRLLTQRECPSWLYPVTMGATTIWERWDSLLSDGSVNPGQMNSFNHYALGAVADWLYRTVAGLAPGEPGYRHLNIQPHPGGGLTSARARHWTPYGLAECSWQIKEEYIEVEVVVPPNTRASVTLPGSDTLPIEVGSGTHRWPYPYQRPGVSRPHWSLDSSLNELIDDQEVWSAVLTTIRQHVPELTDHMEVGTGMQNDGSMTLRQILALLPHAGELRMALEATLASLEH
jgi:alpha-L-rhamnosidase